MATLDFFNEIRIAEVRMPDIRLDVQEAYDQISDYSDEPGVMDIARIVRASGKDPLGAGRFVGITLVMMNGWRLRFAAQPGPATVQTFVSGGNTLTDIVEQVHGVVVGGPYIQFEPITFSGGGKGFYVDDVDGIVLAYVQTQLPIPLSGETVMGDVSGAMSTVMSEQLPGNPLAASAFTHATIAQSTSASIIEVGIADTTMGTMFRELWAEKGLDVDNPVTFSQGSPATFTFGGITVTATVNPDQSVTLQRST